MLEANRGPGRRRSRLPLPADPDLVRAAAALVRAHQDAVCDRRRAADRLRSLLLEHRPAALAALEAEGIEFTVREARTVLASAATASAHGMRIRTLLLRLEAARRAADDLADAIEEFCRRHPGAAVWTSPTWPDALMNGPAD